MSNIRDVATVNDIRRENARLLARECNGLAEFARRIGRGDPYVSQLLGRTPSRGIGHATARLIERAFSKPEGWLDQPSGAEGLSDSTLAVARFWESLTEDEQARLRQVFTIVLGRNVPDDDEPPAAPPASGTTVDL